MTYAQLVTFIVTWIKENHNREITGSILQDVLLQLSAYVKDSDDSIDLSIENLQEQIDNITINAGVRRFLGVEDPNVTPPMEVYDAGDLYVNTSNDRVYVFTGSGWFYVNRESAVNAIVREIAIDEELTKSEVVDYLKIMAPFQKMPNDTIVVSEQGGKKFLLVGVGVGFIGAGGIQVAENNLIDFGITPDPFNPSDYDLDDFQNASADPFVRESEVPAPTDLSTGLEAIDEGNGIGWRLKGANPNNYGNIGFLAVDLGVSNIPSDTVGATAHYSNVGGGLSNKASGIFSTVGGGSQNEASGLNSTVGGGVDNEVSGNYSNVGGGSQNKAIGNYSNVGGGNNNEVSGTYSNVAGGSQNKASGNYSNVSGGRQNIAKTLGEFLGGLWSTIKEGNATQWIGTDRIFGIGNGKSSSQRSDAFNVYKNGVAELPSVTNALIDAAGEKTIPTKEWVASQNNFTTQEITSGGNYNDLEVTADLLIFTNENAQAILNGVWGRKEFHILNLSETYGLRINHDSSSVTDPNKRIKLPTAGGSVDIKGTARVLQTDDYGYFVADTWASKYRPEFTGLTETEVITVDPNSNADTMPMRELYVYRDAQTTPMTDAELNIAYPNATRPFQVVCSQLNVIYLKENDVTNMWKAIPLVQNDFPKLHSIKKTFTGAEVENWDTAPLELIPPVGAGYLIDVISAHHIARNGTSFSEDPEIRYSDALTGHTYWSMLGLNFNFNQVLEFKSAGGRIKSIGAGLVLTGSGGGSMDGELDVYITYQIIKL